MRHRSRGALVLTWTAIKRISQRLSTLFRWNISTQNFQHPAFEAEDAEAGGGGSGGGGGGGGSGDGGGLLRCRGQRRRQSPRRAQHLVLRVLAMLTIGAAVVGAVGVLGWLLGVHFVLQVVIVLAVVFFVTSGALQWTYVSLVTLPRDFKAVTRYIGLLIQARGVQRRNGSIVDLFRDRVKKHPNKPCFVFEDETWTFAEVEAYSNKVARAFQKEGYRKGDVVALMLENRPEFVCLWVGLAKLGVIVPLINYNLRLHPLLHSIRAAKARALIFGSELVGAVKDVSAQLPPDLTLFRWGTEPHTEASDLAERNLTALLGEVTDATPEVAEPPGYRDPLVYIYTSGTTGLPKAAVITHSRFFFIAGAISWLAGFRASDRFYVPLPLYHTAGGVMSVGQALMYGSTVVIRRKFSASSYFPDVKRYECTVAQYIGEMCRYILAVPSRPDDRQHKLRLIYGNGLRPQIWTQFVERFGIPRVAEFYGATEGNANIMNVDNTVGAIGFVSRIMPFVYPISIIRVDQLTGEPLRNEKGLCMPCKPDEPGVFIGKIVPSNPAREFLGYVDKEASQKKIVHDVFKKGDSAFLSGDILVADKWGSLFFKDRTGDTFRWKGENVSTSEVEAVISNVIHYRDCVVYGVQVPGSEGRAGMAAVVDPAGTLDLVELTDGMRKALPPYARPQFLRILCKVDLTGTFKLKKKDLQEEGFNPARVKDRLLYLDGPSGRYEPLTEEVFSRIHAGAIRF